MTTAGTYAIPNLTQFRFIFCASGADTGQTWAQASRTIPVGAFKAMKDTKFKIAVHDDGGSWLEVSIQYISDTSISVYRFQNIAKYIKIFGIT